jgi:hypothetical protein
MLVTIPAPRAVARANSYKEVHVVGSAYATGSNAQGGLNLMKLADGSWDANPESIWVWPPLDGTALPAVSTTIMGTKYEVTHRKSGFVSRVRG